MLHKALVDYLENVEQTLIALEDAYVERYVEEILTPQRVTLGIRVRFAAGHLLEINEAMVVKTDTLVWLDYRYHCQDEQNRLIFRYDSTPHFPDLPSFPHHKHLPDEVIASQKPDIYQVLQEAVNV
jgi:hypothetical protein